MIRRTLTAFVAALTLALTAGCGPDGGGEAPAASGQITIGSNPAGTHVYAVAAGLAKVLQEKAGLRVTMRPYAGSSVYLPLLQRGEISFGLNTGIDSYLSYNGLPPYSEAMDELRAVGVIFPLPIMYMVRADSGLARIEDLRGKRVVIREGDKSAVLPEQQRGGAEDQRRDCEHPRRENRGHEADISERGEGHGRHVEQEPRAKAAGQQGGGLALTPEGKSRGSRDQRHRHHHDRQGQQGLELHLEPRG